MKPHLPSECWSYGKKIADVHFFENAVKEFKPRKWDTGPMCYACGLTLGTIQYELVFELHYKRTGHYLGTGACEEQCNPTGTKDWWEIEPLPEEGGAMKIGVSVYCENEDCEVEVYTKTVDQASAKQLNCPCCGQFGRTKGRPSQSSRSLGTEPPDTDPHD